MTSGLLSAELAATCNAIGFYDGIKYHLEPHSKETIKDIIRYLRRDEETHDIRRFLGNSKILKTDLLPILKCHSKDKDLFEIILRLIVNLSTPALIVYNEVVPGEKSELNQYIEIVTHLQSYKEAFGDHSSWAVLTDHLSVLLNKDVDNREEEDQRTIERILILVRNVLHVPSDVSAEGRPDNDASVHDQVIWALHQSSILDLLLYMASTLQESMFFMHLLEIICLLVREQPPSLLAKTAALRSSEEKHRDEEELMKLRQKEQQIRQNKTRQYLGARHSNFGGTFVIKNMKSTTENDLIYHKPLHKVNHFSLDVDKKKVKIPKNRQPLKCSNVERRSALSVRLILKQFCVEILNAAYNPLMRYIKDSLSRGKTQDNDESYYFTAMKFFMEFNRTYKFQVKLVSETMSVDAFHFSQKYLETWHEMMVTDKKKIALWSARMHLALKAYKELLHNLAVMDSNPDETVRESSKVIKSNIFYVVEYREMLLILINTYKKSKYSQQYLVDLMETTHIFFKLLDKFSQNKKVVVQNTVRKHKKAKPKKKKQEVEQVLAAEELWPQIHESLEKIFQSPITKEVIPFDAASEKGMEEQKVDAMKRIKIFMKSGDFEECVALLRSSREVWPENDCFGNASMSQEEELSCLKEVFLADLDIPDALQKNKEVVEEEIDDDEDEEEETVYPTLEEKTFDMIDLTKRFASPKVLGVCISLLSSFEKNTPHTNHCVAKMLHRIAWDCKLPSLLFQASLFRKFQLILESKDPSLKELANLAIYIIRKFTQIAETNKKIFMELLFFKNAKEAYEIECGYGSFQQRSKPSKQNWEDHEEDELRRLHEEYLTIMPSQGMVEWITEQMISERSSRIVKKKMKELGLHIIVKNKKGLATSWTEEQDEELKDLYREFKEEDSGVDIIDKILEKLNIKRSRQSVVKALVRLGCAESTAEFSKKSKKSGPGGSGKNNDSSESESESSDEDDVVVTQTREEIRSKESTPDLYYTTRLIFSEKEINSYLTEGLKWLGSCMEDCLEDLDEDPTEVPLLPLSSEALLSVENSEFKLFLSSLGIFRPLQQEIYWRFPATWKEADFKTREKLLKLIAENDSDEHRDEINSLIKEITGKDPAENSDESDNPESMSPIHHTPASKKSQKPKDNKPKSKLQELKNKLIGKNKPDSDTKEKVTKGKNNVSKVSKKFFDEDLEDASTEDFNAIVAEQCREILQNEGMDVSTSNISANQFDSDSEDEMETFSKKSKLVSSDSEVETIAKIPSKGIPSYKKSKFDSSDSEDETIAKIPSKGIPSSKKSKLDSSDSEDDTIAKIPSKGIPSSKKSKLVTNDSDDQTIAKIPSKGIPSSKKSKLDSSDSEDETIAKIPSKGIPSSKKYKLDSSDSEDETIAKIPSKGIPSSKKYKLDSSDSEDETIAKIPSKGIPSSKKSKSLDTDSEDEGMKDPKTSDDKENNAPVRSKNSRLIQSDSEDDIEAENGKNNVQSLTNHKINFNNEEISESFKNTKKSKRSRFMDSDSEDGSGIYKILTSATKLSDPSNDDLYSNKDVSESRKLRLLQSDSEDEVQPSTKKDLPLSSDRNVSQDGIPASKRSRLTLDSESEDDSLVEIKKKKRHLIESDEDD